MPRRFHWPADKDSDELRARLSPSDSALPVEVVSSARATLDDVRRRGDAAVIAATARFDRVLLEPGRLRVTREEIAASAARTPPELRAAIELAIRNVRAFHEPQRMRAYSLPVPGGGEVALLWRPVRSAALYVPGGRAAYPSSVVMNAVPALVAGVPRLAAFTVPGIVESNPAVAAALELLGISEVYRVGGAQAVAAAAFGTESIAPCDVIVGPGNAWVAAAKREVFGRVGIDSIAGPSEVLILADDSADPELVARDLLAQAEHDPIARCVLATPSASLADAVESALARLLPVAPRREIALPAWRDRGIVLLAESVADLVSICEAMAPEHLQVILRDPPPIESLPAGAIFIGNATPTALGDYMAGPNHVLPTGGAARFSGPLGVLSFLRPTSIVRATPETMRALAPPAATLADAEALAAHADALRARLGDGGAA